MTRAVPSRKLISEDQCIVVLDTSPARNLAHAESLPEWIDTFAAMSEDGYSFSLADGAFAELLAQRSSGRIPEAGFQRLVSALTRFLNPKLPVLPGKRDIEQMICTTEASETWTEAAVYDLSTRAWDALKISHVSNRTSVEATLDEERTAWIEMFSTLEPGWRKLGSPTDLNELQHSQLDEAFRHLDDGQRITPSRSIRCDLQVRLLWRQFARSKKLKDPYDPTSVKKLNDGIDFDLYRYLQLPAFVVAEDSGFFSRIENIPSFQRHWFWKPADLAAAWTSGTRPFPQWPT